MKYLFIALGLVLSLNVSAQNVVEKYFNNHLDNPDATVVQVSGKMFQYISKVVPEDIADEEDMPVEDAKEMLDNITSFTLVKVDDIANPVAEYRSGMRALGEEYEELVRVADKENKVSILVHEENDVIYEIVGLVATENEFVAASLTGTLKLDQIQNIISKMEDAEMTSVLRNKEVNLDKMKVYPNPVNGSDASSVTVEVPENLVGGELIMYDLDGKVIHKTKADQSVVTLTPDYLANGNYIIEVAKSGVSMKKKLIVVE